ncbi:MAG: hypothetical protein H6736_22565 [Alphaproteobacteria bacterium]|nr:hypothetical protein [Alphaproteobacteria bacterium]MCB9694603.1 hypothetical protein [Alphaproteobacteria bacterium]
MTAVAVWTHAPTADELLDDRLERGWAPIPSGLADGPRVLGHAAKVPSDRWRWEP